MRLDGMVGSEARASMNGFRSVVASCSEMKKDRGRDQDNSLKRFSARMDSF